MEIKWPMKIIPKDWNNIDKRNYGSGYNAAIDACKKAVENFLNNPSSLTVHIFRNWDRENIVKFATHLLGDEAQPSGLVELDARVVAKYLEDKHAIIFNSLQWTNMFSIVQSICSTFGTKPRPVVTKENLTKLLFKKLEGILPEGLLMGICLELSEAIIKHLEQGE